MFCQYCGARGDEGSKFCVQCGAAAPPSPEPQPEPQNAHYQWQSAPPPGYQSPHQQYQHWQPQPQKRTNGMAIAGLVLAFFMPLIGLIVSVVARNQITRNNEDGMGIAKAGIIISVLSMLFWLFVGGLGILGAVFAYTSNYWYW